MKLLNFLTLMMIVNPVYSYAQGHSGVGGGDPNELASFKSSSGDSLESWYGVKVDLIHGLQIDKESDLDLKGVSGDEFKTKFLYALENAKVEFDQRDITVDQSARPCENFTDATGIMRIHCNIDRYKAAMAGYKIETQYKIIAHEYLGVCGLEPNVNGVSDYRYSSQISTDLSVTVQKKWGVLSQLDNITVVGDFTSEELYDLLENKINVMKSKDPSIDSLSQWMSIELSTKGYNYSGGKNGDRCGNFGRITETAGLVLNKKFNGTVAKKVISSVSKSRTGFYSICQGGADFTEKASAQVRKQIFKTLLQTIKNKSKSN